MSAAARAGSFLSAAQLAAQVAGESTPYSWMGQPILYGTNPLAAAVYVAGLASRNQGVFVGGPNVVYGPRSTWGDPTPTDVGFTAQAVAAADQYAQVLAAQPQFLQAVTQYLLKDTGPLPDLDTPGAITLDLAKTKVLDSSVSNTLHGYLRDVLAMGPQGGVGIALARAKVYAPSGLDTPLSQVLQVQAGSGAAADAGATGGAADARRTREDCHGQRPQRRPVRLQAGRDRGQVGRWDGVLEGLVSFNP